MKSSHASMASCAASMALRVSMQRVPSKPFVTVPGLVGGAAGNEC